MNWLIVWCNLFYSIWRYVEYDGQTVFQYLVELEEKNLVKHLDQDGQQWTRVIIAAEEEDTHSSLFFIFCLRNNQIRVFLFTEVILYKSISELSDTFRPTIAIITVNYFEKLAVDAMIENKVTFIRHHKQGRTFIESELYNHQIWFL